MQTLSFGFGTAVMATSLAIFRTGLYGKKGFQLSLKIWSVSELYMSNGFGPPGTTRHFPPPPIRCHSALACVPAVTQKKQITLEKRASHQYLSASKL